MPLERTYKDSRILVTGGAGFIGSHLCERLLAEGAEVVCVDNYFTGSRRNIAHLLANPLFEAVRHDVTFPLYVEVDAIFNLACPASPIHYQRDPVQTTKTSVHGAINMLGLAKRLGARIFQASTSEVYGDPLIHPQTGRILGQRQSDRHPLLLRRGQALRRNPVLRLLAPAPTADQGGAHLQYLRPADAARTTAAWCRPSSCRRSRASRSPCSATAARPARSAMSTISSRRITRLMLTDEDCTGPINLGNNSEFTILELAEKVIELHRLPVEADLQAAAAGRSAAAPARSCQGQGACWTGSRRSRSTTA